MRLVTTALVLFSFSVVHAAWGQEKINRRPFLPYKIEVAVLEGITLVRADWTDANPEVSKVMPKNIDKVDFEQKFSDFVRKYSGKTTTLVIDEKRSKGSSPVYQVRGVQLPKFSLIHMAPIGDRPFLQYTVQTMYLLRTGESDVQKREQLEEKLAEMITEVFTKSNYVDQIDQEKTAAKDRRFLVATNYMELPGDKGSKLLSVTISHKLKKRLQTSTASENIYEVEFAAPTIIDGREIQQVIQSIIKEPVTK